MRRRPPRRESPFIYAAVGASVLAIPATAAAVAPGPTVGAPGATIKARVKHQRIAYDRRVVVTGRAPSSDRGQTVALQLSPTRTGGWRQIASERISDDGSFHLVAWLKTSGWLRAITDTPVATATALPAGDPQPSTSSSAPEKVAVAAAIRLRPRTINDLGDRTIHLRGELLPGGARRRILLQADRSGRWVNLTVARTNGHGDFELRYRPGATDQERLRIRFPGDRSNAAVSHSGGSLTVYRQTIASWYDDGGNTACGFHAYYGVANVGLPCGTRVNFVYGGRRVQAVVDDRGPYVGGRSWDLNQNTAGALGFVGVGAVWSSR